MAERQLIGITSYAQSVQWGFWDTEGEGAAPLTPNRIRDVWRTLLPHVDRKVDDDWGWAAELLAASPTIPTLEKPLTLSALYFMLAVNLAIPPVNVPVRKPTPLRPPRRSGERHTIQ